jgi:hypothetical protein
MLPPEAQAALLSGIYSLWADTRKRVPSGLGLACYQAMSTPRHAHYNRYTDQRVRVYDITY